MVTSEWAVPSRLPFQDLLRVSCLQPANGANFLLARRNQMVPDDVSVVWQFSVPGWGGGPVEAVQR